MAERRIWRTCLDPHVRDEHHEGVRVVYTTRCERCDARDRGEPDVPDGCGPMPRRLVSHPDLTMFDADTAGEG